MLTKLLFASTCTLASLCFLSEKTLAQIQWTCSTAGLNQAYGSTQPEAYNRSLLQCASNTPSAAGEPSPCQPQNVVCNQTGLFPPQPQPPQPQPPQPQPPQPQPPQPQPPQPQQPSTVPLKLYWNPQRQDNFTTASQSGQRDAVGSGYVFVRDEGCVFPTQQPGTVPLKLYWNPQRQDNFTTATQQGERDAVGSGYRFVSVEGYIHPSVPPPRSLNGSLTGFLLFWSPQRQENFTTATGEGMSDARAVGYKYVRNEGFVVKQLGNGKCP